MYCLKGDMAGRFEAERYPNENFRPIEWTAFVE